MPIHDFILYLDKQRLPDMRQELLLMEAKKMRLVSSTADGDVDVTHEHMLRLKSDIAKCEKIVADFQDED